MKSDFRQFVTPLAHPVTTSGGDGKAALSVIFWPIFNRCHHCHYVATIKQHIKEKVMKSIEVYRRKVNNREKGSDSSDTCDTAIAEQPRSHVHTYTACCYLLWGTYHRSKWKSPDDRRIYDNGEAKSICVRLTGVNRRAALSKLDTNAYEFIEWWS